MNIRPIRTKTDYQAALQGVSPYFDNEPEIDSEAGAHFEAMMTLIKAYEAKHYPITALLELRGTGQGMLGAGEGQTVSELRDEWDN